MLSRFSSPLCLLRFRFDAYAAAFAAACTTMPIVTIIATPRLISAAAMIFSLIDCRHFFDYA